MTDTNITGMRLNEAGLRAATEAYWRALFAKATAAVDDSELSLAELFSFFCSITREADRSLAILAFSYFEDLLKELFKEELQGHAKKLLEPTQPLSTASSQLRLAYGLHWLSSSTYKNLDILRKIRNEFAHKVTCRRFQDEPIITWINELTPTEMKIFTAVYGDEAPQRKFTSREKFYSRSVITICHAVAELLARPPAIRAGLNPEHLPSIVDGLPKKIAVLHKAAAFLVMEFCKIGVPARGTKGKITKRQFLQELRAADKKA